MVDHINNGEEGYSVRGKLNEVIDRTNTLNGIENQVEANKNLSQQNKAAIEKEVQDRKDADAALQAEIDKKADSDHKHEIADVNGLQDILDNKQESGDYVTEAPDDGYQYARQFIVDDPDGEGAMTWTVVRAGGGDSGGGGAGMVIRATPPEPDDRVVGMQWLNELNGEVWIWDGTRWLEFPAEGGLHKGGGGGIPFPAEELRTGQWLAYRQLDDVYDPVDGSLVSEGVYEWGILTTDMVSTNPALDDPDARFKFARWGEDLAGLDNQLKVNRFIYDKLIEVEERAVNFGFVEVPNGQKILKQDTDLLNHGGPVAQDDCLILHLDPADCTTTPCQKLVFVCPEGQEVIDHFNATQQEAIFKVVQIDPTTGGALAQTMRGIDGGSMSGDVYTIECDQVYGETLMDGVECQLLVRTSSAITAEWVENNFVHKRGGDSMEGPLVIKAQDVQDARATKKVETLGVYSGSESSALRLGVGDQADKIYIGQNDTSFNGPIKVGEITERHENEGIKIDDSLIFDPRGHEIMRIRPQDGATHTITTFSNGTSNGTKLDIKLYGNTYKNAIRIFAKSSAASNIAQIGSDGAINLYTQLDMNQKKVTDIADATLNTDAVNLRTLNAAIAAIPAPPETDLSGIEARLDGHDEDIAEINQKLEDIRDQSALCEMVYRAGLVYPQSDGDLTGHRSDGSATGFLSAIRYFLVDEKDYNGATVPWDQLGSGVLELKGGDSSYFFTLDSVAQDGSNPTWRLNVSGGYSTDGQDFQGGEQLLIFAPVGGTRSITTATLPLENPQDPPENVRDYTNGWKTQADANESFTKSILETADALVFWRDEIGDFYDTTDERLTALESSAGGLPDGDLDLNGHRITNASSLNFKNDGYPSITVGTNTKIEFSDRVLIKKGQTLDSRGFELDGRTDEGNHKPLFYAYHRASGSDEIHYKGRTTDNTHLATVGFVRDEIAKSEGSGGAEASVTHTMMGKGSWGASIDELATDKFIAFDYNGRTRNVLDQYVMGIAVAGRFGNEFTEGLEWKQGAYVEVYDSQGKLRFAKEIDSIEHDEKGYLRLHWEWQPTMYTDTSAISYGTAMALKVTGLTGDVRQSRSSVLAPPEGDPHIGE